MIILGYACDSQSHSILFVCLLLFFCWGSVVKKELQKLFRGVNKQHEAIGSKINHQELSKSFRRCQEASGSIRKAQHQNKNKQTNKVQ